MRAAGREVIKFHFDKNGIFASVPAAYGTNFTTDKGELKWKREK